MADTNNLALIQHSGGRGSLSTFNAANGAVNTYLPCSKSQKALSTDLTQFTPKGDAMIVDWVAGAATGTIQLEEDGDMKAYFIDYAQHQASNAGRPALQIPLKAGRIYRFKVISVLPA